MNDDLDDPDRAEYARAASAYLIWPLSLVALAREPPATSVWLRIHTRQAAVYGLALGAGYVILLAVPLVIVIGSPSISTGTTVLVYGIGLLADVIAFALALARTVSYANRAARGELFRIPLVSALTDRVYRLRR